MTQPLPQTGGSWIRNADGGLHQADAPAPPKPAPKAPKPSVKED